VISRDGSHIKGDVNGFSLLTHCRMFTYEFQEITRYLNNIMSLKHSDFPIILRAAYHSFGSKLKT